LRPIRSSRSWVRRTDAAAAVAVKIFIEQHVVAEVRIVLLARVLREHGSFASLVLEEYFGQTHGDLARRRVDGDEIPRSRGALDFEIVAVIVMELLQGFDQQVVDREPDRARASSNSQPNNRNPTRRAG